MDPLYSFQSAIQFMVVVSVYEYGVLPFSEMILYLFNLISHIRVVCKFLYIVNE